MNLLDILAVYLLLGAASALAVDIKQPARGARRLSQAVLSLLVWPLWAPVVLGAKREPFAAAAVDPEPGSAADRIVKALSEAMEAAAGTPLEPLLPRRAGEAIAREVARAADRHRELGELARREKLDLGEAEKRLANLEHSGASPRAVASARLSLENVRRVLELLERDRRALQELDELTAALRTQLLLARVAGSAPEGVGGIVQEVWARVEGLGAAIDAQCPEPSPEVMLS